MMITASWQCNELLGEARVVLGSLVIRWAVKSIKIIENMVIYNTHYSVLVGEAVLCMGPSLGRYKQLLFVPGEHLKARMSCDISWMLSCQPPRHQPYPAIASGRAIAISAQMNHPTSISISCAAPAFWPSMIADPCQAHI